VCYERDSDRTQKNFRYFFQDKIEAKPAAVGEGSDRIHSMVNGDG